MIGLKFGKWTVISERMDRKKHGQIMFECICECGLKQDQAGTQLRANETRQCRNCYISEYSILDAVGKKYGDRDVVGKIYKRYRNNDNQLYYKAMCFNEHIAYFRPGHLKRLESSACNKCKYPDVNTNAEPNHYLRATWRNIKRRCLDPRNKNFKNYGGRGIMIDPLWMDFSIFLEDVGERPEGMTLDRINNDGNYELGNVRWATIQEQQYNKRIAPSHSKDYVGLRIGKWLVIKSNGLDRRGARLWECICDCGTIKNHPTSTLTRKISLQCKSCYMKEMKEDRERKHRDSFR